MHMQQKQRMLLLTKKLNVMASFYPMYDFAVKVGGDCLMLIWQHFGKKEVYYIISAGLGEDIIERSLGDMDGFVEHLEEYRIAGKNYRTHISYGILLNETTLSFCVPTKVPLWQIAARFESYSSVISEFFIIKYIYL